MDAFAYVIGIQIFGSICVLSGTLYVLGIVRLIDSLEVELAFIAFEVRVELVVRHLVHAKTLSCQLDVVVFQFR